MLYLSRGRMESYKLKQQEIRKSLLIQSLNHIPFDGWTEKSLLAAAVDLNIEAPVALNAFPGGGLEMIALHSQIADQWMEEDYQLIAEKPHRLSEKVALLIRLRMQPWSIYREAIKSGLGLLAMPSHAALGARLLYETIDRIWRILGDKSVDFNFYTKRATLAAIYSATLLYWLEDKSSDHHDTWLFLERRLAMLGKIPKWKANITKWQRYTPNPFLLYRNIRARTSMLSKRVRE